MKKLYRKSFFTLLEVMIAFILVVMCIFPLIYPHSFILIEQNKFIQEIEADHLVNLLYADIIERLYRNEIAWNPLVTGQVFPVDEQYLQKIQYDKQIPYDASFRFSEIKHKPRKQGEVPTHFLLKLEFAFLPKGKTIGSDGKLPQGRLQYAYEVFIIKDLGQEILPEEEEEGQGDANGQELLPGQGEQQGIPPTGIEDLRGSVPSTIKDRFKKVYSK